MQWGVNFESILIFTIIILLKYKSVFDLFCGSVKICGHISNNPECQVSGYELVF